MLKINHPTVVKCVKTAHSVIKSIAFPFGIVQNICSTLISTFFKGVKKGVEKFVNENPQVQSVEVKGMEVNTETIIETCDNVSKVIETAEVMFDTYTIFSNLGTITGLISKFVPIVLPTIFPPYLTLVGLGVGIVLGVSYFLCS